MAKKRIEKAKKSPAYGKLAAWLLAGITLVIGSVLLILQPSGAVDVVVYKSPTCGCCKDWVSHLKENGFTVDVQNRSNMNPIKTEMGVPRHLQSCHTAKVGGYTVEGHVPADLITRLLKEKPPIKGLAVPGMPMGSPGMEGPRKDPYDVLALQENGKTTVYASRNQQENRAKIEEMMKLQARMEQALEQWKLMPNGIPDGNSVCHLIESIESDEDKAPVHTVDPYGGNDGTSSKRT